MFGPLVLMISFAVSIASSSSSSWFYVVNVHSSWDKGICCFKCSIECNLKCAHYCSILTSSSTENKLEFKVHHREFELKTWQASSVHLQPPWGATWRPRLWVTCTVIGGIWGSCGGRAWLWPGPRAKRHDACKEIPRDFCISTTTLNICFLFKHMSIFSFIWIII